MRIGQRVRIVEGPAGNPFTDFSSWEVGSEAEITRREHRRMDDSAIYTLRNSDNFEVAYLGRVVFSARHYVGEYG